jgi:hypothetical protein
MKKLLLILTLCVGFSGFVTAQCTISQATITNASVASGVANFSLVFKHVRNAGNKWITIHMWNSPAYPGYSYNDPPTTIKLGGVKPFGTIVINNNTVSGSGTYGATAFASTYQQDGTFVMLNTASSTIVYDASTDTYTLTNLQVTLPPNTVVIKFDAWSSQSATNQNVHCYYTNNDILVPAVLPATGLNESFKVYKKDGYIHFTWTTNMESHNSHFVIEKLEGQQYKEMAVVFSKTEDGNSDTPINYNYKMKLPDPALSSMGWIFVVFACSMLFRKYIPFRLVCIVAGLWVFGVLACSKKDSLIEKQLYEQWYHLKQVDIDKNSSTTNARMIRL